MNIRLHMVNVRANYGEGTCRKCNLVEETTEHVVQIMTDGSHEAVEECMEDTRWLKRTCRIFEQFETIYDSRTKTKQNRNNNLARRFGTLVA